ncbi:MAG: pseudouridine synthase [Erysipelotrichales bacterium]|nr:MAG: pseudouridine synthase [Erysipelotrichales bacterium]
MRLNNYIGATGLCSRREADDYIVQNRVTVNGIPAVLGMKVDENDVVMLDGKILKGEPKKVTLAYHKPVGITCTSERSVAGNIIDAVDYPDRIFPIGRLDKDSEGLILLTSDGSIVNRILRAENGHEKEYIVNLTSNIKPGFKKAMESGVTIYNPVRHETTKTLPCKIKIESDTSFKIILNQGLNRQIRRMCSELGYTVARLKRIRIMNIDLGFLPKGKWRELSEEEYAGLLEMLKETR